MYAPSSGRYSLSDGLNLPESCICCFLSAINSVPTSFAPIGAGGMGEVYRAKDSRLGSDLAVKVLPEHTLPGAWRRKICFLLTSCRGRIHHYVRVQSLSTRSEPD
jgi:hypothetical protein